MSKNEELLARRALLPKSFSYRTRFAAITRKGARPNLVLQTLVKELNRAQ